MYTFVLELSVYIYIYYIIDFSLQIEREIVAGGSGRSSIDVDKDYVVQLMFLAFDKWNWNLTWMEVEVDPRLFFGEGWKSFRYLRGIVLEGVRERELDDSLLHVPREVLLDLGHQISGGIRKSLAQFAGHQAEYRVDVVLADARRVNRVDAVADVIIITIDVFIVAQVRAHLRQLRSHY